MTRTPHLDLERNLLGAMILYAPARKAAEILSPADFAEQAHRTIFRAIKVLSATESAVDLVLLCHELATDMAVQAIGGAPYVASLIDGLYPLAPFDAWAETILRAAKQRRLADLGQSLVKGAAERDADVVTLAANAQRDLAAIGETSISKIVGKRASEVEPENIRWLWEGRLVRGKINVLDGDPGTGKSTMTIDLAARLSRGLPMPGGSDVIEGGTVILSSEDSAHDTIVPRLIAAGADLKRIRVLAPDTLDFAIRWPRIPDGLATLEAAVKDVGAVLLVIDPWVAFLDPDCDNATDQDVRGALAPLAAFADRLDLSPVLIRHLVKTGGSSNVLHRGGGSMGIIAAARVGLLAAIDPQDPLGKVLAVTKGNLAALAPSQRYRLVERLIPGADRNIKTSGLEWLGDSEYVAGELLTPAFGEDLSEEAEAMEFLRCFLEDGPVSSKQVLAEAKKEGHKEHTLRRAKKRLGVEAVHHGFGSEGGWNWQLPASLEGQDTAKVITKGASRENLAALEQVVETKPFESITSLKMARESELTTLAHGLDALAGDQPQSANARAGQGDGYIADPSGVPGVVCTSCGVHYMTVSGWRAHVAQNRCLKVEATA